MPVRFLAFTLAALAILAASAQAAYAACGGKLGTKRTISVSAKRFNSIQGYEKRLGLRDKEVILTFDDGPLSTTSRVLRALDNECVKATFFVVGRNVARTPSKVRAMNARGHTIAHHTWAHENLAKLSNAKMAKTIDRGIRAVNKALYGSNSARARNPMFRYPYLAKSKRTRAMLRRKGLVEIGTNIDTGDWKRQTPAQLHDRIMRQLKKKRRGIVLMHDIQPRTAKMLPRLLRSMKAAGFRVVHMVPSGGAQPKAVEVAALDTKAETRSRKKTVAKTSKASKKVAKKKRSAVVKVSAKRSKKSVKKAVTARAKASKARKAQAKRSQARKSQARKSKASLKRVAKKTKRAAKRRVAKKTKRKAKRTRRVARRNLASRFIIN